jgi:transposase
MAKGYRPVDRDQPFLLPPDMREWLPRDHAVWLVIQAVALLDTSVFHARRRTGGAGVAGYDPDMMVTLLIWAYANGVTSSRRIERLCGQDVAFRVICAGNLPDHVTVARFRQQFAVTAGGLFAQVLVLCARLGMGRAGTVALDGTKTGANASREANRTEEGLRKLAADLGARHAAADAEEDALSGDGRGDDDPGDPFTRRERVAAALASIAAERAAAEAAERAAAEEHLKAARAGTPSRGRPPAGAEAEAARIRLAKETAAALARTADYERRKAAGQAGTRRRPVPPEESSLVRRAQAKLDRALAREAGRKKAAAEKAPAVRNVTDPDSRLMPLRGGGFLQGCNPQNVATQDGLLLATRLTADTTDTRWYQPVITAALAAAALIAAHRPPVPAAGDGQVSMVLADAGYLSDGNLAAPGPARLIATGKRRDLEKQARTAAGGGDPGEEGRSALITAMAERLAAEDGIAAYRQRGHIAETPTAASSTTRDSAACPCEG